MLENDIKVSTCQVRCDGGLGTGFLVTNKLILTAYHCVSEASSVNTPINVSFPKSDFNSEVLAVVHDKDESLDICLLSISEPLDIKPLVLGQPIPREGSQWYAFGYPQSKSIGHKVSGDIAQVLREIKLRMDIDLSVELGSVIDDYRGLSGSAMICDGVVSGLVRLKLQGTLGSLSTHQMVTFLEKNDVPYECESNLDNPRLLSDFLVDRDEFQNDFEAFLQESAGRYVFLEGAHGVGKTTFCKDFRPHSSSLLILGSYTFSQEDGGAGVVLKVQPDFFHDWLSTSVSNLLTDEPSRKENKPYSELIVSSNRLITDFSGYCRSKKSQGVIFIDALNEAKGVGSEAFSKLLGLLPQAPPPNITIVLTAPNYDEVAVSLDGRVQATNTIKLPLLDDEKVKEYCWQVINPSLATSTLISCICDKAQGHPLYLRYLIEYTNNKPDDQELDEFPVFSGTIETYYEKLWSRLLQDQEATNLLGIICRLRWGVQIGDLLKMLTTTEQAVFVPTFSRIQHLLLNPAETSIYHSSFADFLIKKTDLMQGTIEERLADFCIKEKDLSYCMLNIVYHSLRSKQAPDEIVSHCSQRWVDQCVTLGMEPDTLLFDIEETLTFAAHNCSTVDIVRLLLLSQRVSFRYNTLFTQSALLATNALVALNRPKDALFHAIRFNTLIIHPEDTFQIAFSLIREEFNKEALKVLALLHEQLNEMFDNETKDFGMVRYYCHRRLRCIFFMGLAEGDNGIRANLRS